MTELEAMDLRHSVRAYRDVPIDPETRGKLDAFVGELNRESGLAIVIRYDDPAGFDSKLAHYGSFRGVRNYIILKGRKTPDFDFACGYWGERLVLFAQTLGLNTCWAALTFNRKLVRQLIPDGETLCMVIALGYGETQGVPHRNKPLTAVCAPDGPAWFTDGVCAALKAPTAVNQQKFFFELRDGEPFARVKGFGSYTKVDLGIAAWHFELASGHKAAH